MNGFTLLIGSAVIFLIAYVVYGSWLAKQWGIDPKRKTPAETQKDGIDYLPTKPAVLLGHHFSSIAGAGPIVGPITAAVFGWVPVTLWIIVGSVFFGGVHDYGSLVASLRHKGKSIGQIIEANIGERAKILFAIFAWITLLVVIAAFANIVAATFVANPSAGTSSLLFILLAVAFGLLVYRTGISLFYRHVAPDHDGLHLCCLHRTGLDSSAASRLPELLPALSDDHCRLPRHLLLSADHGDFSVCRL